jgi:hypothetical protein
MKFRRFISSLGLSESLKEVELNKILDKISKKINLSSKEKDFLGKYDDIDDNDLKDMKMLSRQHTFEAISNLVKKDKKIICNLIDRNGRIGIQITSIYNDFENEICVLHLKNGEEVTLKDNFLYNILYDLKTDKYSLEAEDEFFEKIPVDNED